MTLMQCIRFIEVVAGVLLGLVVVAVIVAPR